MGVDVLGRDVRLVADGARVHHVDRARHLRFADRPASDQLQRGVSLGANLIGEERRGSDIEIAIDVDVQCAFVNQADAAGGMNLAGRSGQIELLDRGRAGRDGDRRGLLLCQVEPAECDVQFLERDLSR